MCWGAVDREEERIGQAPSDTHTLHSFSLPLKFSLADLSGDSYSSFQFLLCLAFAAPFPLLELYLLGADCSRGISGGHWLSSVSEWECWWRAGGRHHNHRGMDLRRTCYILIKMILLS